MKIYSRKKFLIILNNFKKYEENVTESLYRHKDVLESIFRAIDKDHSGHISHEEFFSACELINKHDPLSKLTNETIIDIANTMDIDKVFKKNKIF